AKGFFRGRDLRAKRPWSQTYDPNLRLPNLLRLLLLIDRGGRGSVVGGELLQVVLQEADFNAASADALGLRGFIRGGSGRIAHSDQVDAIDRDLMVEDEIANHRLGHLLRVGDCGLSLAGREALHFDDVAALAFHAAGHSVQSVLGILAQDGLAGPEADLSLVGSLVLVDVANHGLHSLDAG